MYNVAKNRWIDGGLATSIYSSKHQGLELSAADVGLHNEQGLYSLGAPLPLPLTLPLERSSLLDVSSGPYEYPSSRSSTQRHCQPALLDLLAWPACLACAHDLTGRPLGYRILEVGVICSVHSAALHIAGQCLANCMHDCLWCNACPRRSLVMSHENPVALVPTALAG